MKNIKELVEAMLFASGEPMTKRELLEKIPELTQKTLNRIIEDLLVKYSGDSGILLVQYDNKLEFSSNPKYGQLVKEALVRTRERELTKSLLEVLSIIAYKQPITRREIEDYREHSAEYALMTLMKVDLIEVVGRKDAIGHPLLYGTTDEFLRKFGLRTIKDLPDYAQILERIKELNKYNPQEDTLFSSRTILAVDEDGELLSGVKVELSVPELEKEEEIPFDVEEELPDFLVGEEKFEVFE